MGDVPEEETLFTRIQRAYDVHAIAAITHLGPLEELFEKDPKAAIHEIPRVWNQMLDDAYTDDDGENQRAFIQAIAGGPCEISGRQLYNIIGDMYPYFDKEQQDAALRQLIGIFDGLNYGQVNGEFGPGHTPGIHEPTLLRDIKIARQLYWPGLDEGKALLKQYPEFEQWEELFLNENGRLRRDRVQSEFLVAYRLLRTKDCSFSEEYVAAAEPAFLERTVRSIVGMQFGGPVEKDVNKAVEIRTRTNKLCALLPESLHDRIEQYRIEGGWTDWRTFNSYHADKYDLLC